MKKTFLLLCLSVTTHVLWSQTRTQSTIKKQSVQKSTGIKSNTPGRKKSNEAVKSEIKKIEADKTLTTRQKKQKIRSVVQQQKASRAKQSKSASKP